MRKTMITLIAILLGTGLIACGTTQPTTTVTTPTTVDTENFIEINSIADLQGLAMNKSYRLMQDLDLEGIEWTPLGSFEEPYLGIFDGNNHTLSNLTITQRNTSFNGLFAHLSGSVSDLEIRDFTIAYTAQFLTYAGGLAGYLSGDVDNVAVSGTITLVNNTSNTYAGLLVGAVVAKVTSTMTADAFVANEITGVSASGSVDIDGKNFVYVGGLAGKIHNSRVERAVVEADIRVTAQNYRIYAGGVVGHHYGGLLIGYEAIVTDSQIPLSTIFANTTVEVTIAGIQASVGGFAGFSQYGVYEDIIAISNLSLAGTKLLAGMFIGESWNGDWQNILATGQIAMTSQADQVAVLDSLAAFANEPTTVTNAFHYVAAPSALTNAYGTPATLAELQDQSWYEGWLDWETSFMSLAELAAFFGE